MSIPWLQYHTVLAKINFFFFYFLFLQKTQIVYLRAQCVSYSRMKAEHLISSKSRHRDIFQNVLQHLSESQISWQMLQNRNVKVGNYYCVQFLISAHFRIKSTRRKRKDDSGQDISKQKMRLTRPRKFPTVFVKLQNCQSQVILSWKKVVSILSWKDQRVAKRDSISQWTASKKSNLKLARLP